MCPNHIHRGLKKKKSEKGKAKPNNNLQVAESQVPVFFILDVFTKLT